MGVFIFLAILAIGLAVWKEWIGLPGVLLSMTALVLLKVLT